MSILLSGIRDRMHLLAPVCTLFAIVMPAISPAQQIAVPRIDQMPDRPSPYLMRDWKAVARGYDSLVFDGNLAGTYLPLVWINTNPVNYPAHNSFGLHTVVGTTAPASAEAINCLPALVGATLSGINKSDQGGQNWVLMAEEWFNRRPEQDIYKNHWVDDMGDDWWYETMPNIFFYQLNYQYPGTGDFTHQFTTVADRWLQAIQAMGGITTPWQIPNMDHRGWYMQTMTPYDPDVHEPEAAGAIAWICYSAFVVTRDPKYRIGAELAMEFLNQWPTNPSYELQLSYGTYCAARMNAEVGTVYDVPKMVNWCFNIGPLRSWGSVVGQWGGYDCSGLIGEVNGVNDYAFAMNTFEQVGALVPMVRYDPRFARAIGKWVLNAANASRLFYRSFLPSNRQDSYAWSQQYDTGSVIGHEALRQFNGSVSPFATGDAVSGGWGQTNLALYGSSHVGIMGGIIDTTDVPMILKLDLLKTDYYHAPAYPSFLFFNPYDSSRTVSFDAGPGQHDLYDIVTKSMLASGIEGIVPVPIQPGAAVIIAILPAGGAITYLQDRMLVDGIVVDYHSGHAPTNLPPRIKALSPDRTLIVRGDTITVYCTATDADNDTLSFTWESTGGQINGTGPAVKWRAPDSAGTDTITCTVSDGHGSADTARIGLTVLNELNSAPVIIRLTANPRKVNPGGVTVLLCRAADADQDSLSFLWIRADSSIIGTDSVAAWTVPSITGNFTAYCLVSDSKGASVFDSIAVEVRDSTQQQTGRLIMYLPFTGNANDSSGNHHDGVVHGALLTPDRFSVANSAYLFNGSTSYIQVPNSTDLNFQQAITVSFWMKISSFPDHEQHPVSHGSWQNRWKVSIGNHTLRWTVKTTSGIKDLDSPTILDLNRYYHVAVCYNGSDVELYLDGYLDAFAPWSGTIYATTIDLTIGQVLPSDPNYNFAGVLDEIRVYDFALSYRAIQDLASGITAIGNETPSGIPSTAWLAPNYPNPFNPSTRFDFQVAASDMVTIRIYDVLGKEVATLVHQEFRPGMYSVTWDATGRSTGVYWAEFGTGRTKIVRRILLLR